MSIQQGTIFNDHFTAYEKTLLAKREIQNSVGHSLHKGTPRESFVKEFLMEHIRADISIGSGEIIDFLSKPSAGRNQFDIVVHLPSFPNLYLGGGCSTFLVESVAATVEVKSTLTKKDLLMAASAGRNVGELTSLPNSTGRNFTPRRFLVAYDMNVAKIETAFKWLEHKYEEVASINTNRPPYEIYRPEDPFIPRATMLDGIFILGKGFILFDDILFKPSQNTTTRFPQMSWMIAECETGALHVFFLSLLGALGGDIGLFKEYMQNMKFSSLKHIPMQRKVQSI